MDRDKLESSEREGDVFRELFTLDTIIRIGLLILIVAALFLA